MSWTDLGGDPMGHHHRLIRSMHKHYQTCIQGTWGLEKLLSTILSCCSDIFAKQTSLLHPFFFWFFYFKLLI